MPATVSATGKGKGGMTLAKQLTHPNINDGWFRESDTMWSGQCVSLAVEKILHTEKSAFQDILVFKSTNHGNVLVLDGVVQCSESDEFAYQEMITHLPLMAHPNPKNVLVIGGGDGGVLREVVRHPCVESVTLCEIDEAVCRVSRKYLPHMAVAFDHPKVTVHIADGFEFLKEARNKDKYDVVITDSSDPVGPAEVLFQDSFYRLIWEALRQDGIFCNQGECQWLHLDLVRQVLSAARLLFPTVDYAVTSVPTYPSGQIGFLIACKAAGRDLRRPAPGRKLDETAQEQLRYYDSKVHEAAFVLPRFARKVLEADALRDAKGKKARRTGGGIQ